MITKSSQRANGQDLGIHLQKTYEQIVEVIDRRGAIASDLPGMFKEWEVQAATLTKCKKYLYSLSIDPDPEQPLTREQYMDFIGRVEETLKLTGQPRAIVSHTKEGREHYHVVWSRIDVDKEKAVHLHRDHEKLMRLVRSFARDYGLTLPNGYEKGSDKKQESQYERERQRETGLSQEYHMEQVTDAWRQSDSARAFVNALARRGYVLAQGRRNDYVVVDFYGGVQAVSRMINDKAIRVKHVRAFLGNEFPLDQLPTVAEARELVDAHRAFVEKSVNEDLLADHVAELKHAQQERRREIEHEKAGLKERQDFLRQSQESEQRAERYKLRADHVAALKAIRLERYRNRPTGLAHFLGRVSGVNLVRKKLHRYQDAKRTREFLQQQIVLKTKQAEEKRTLTLRLKLQTQTAGQKEKALERIEKRELAALTRDMKCDQRARDRGEGGIMPSLAKLSGRPGVVQERPAQDLLREKEKSNNGELINTRSHREIFNEQKR